MKYLYFLVILFYTSVAIATTTKVEHAQLSNGMQVYVIENHRNPIVSHMVLYRVGGYDDPRGQSGLAHFLEHLMFRGTHDVKDITILIEKSGGVFNATTTSYYTNYFETVPKDKLDVMMKLEADRMFNLDIKEEAVISERKIVAEERRMRIDNSPSVVLDEKMLSVFYRHYNSWQVAGWMDEISKLNKDKALSLYKKFYSPSNAILFVVGDTTLDQVLSLANKHYGHIESVAKDNLREVLYEPKHDADITVVLQNHKVKQEEVRLWYQAPSISEKNALAFAILSQILGGGKTGYFYKQLVLENIATHVEVDYNPFVLGQALFEIKAISDLGLLEVEQNITKIINQLAQQGVTEADLNRAKNMMKARLIYSAESIIGQCNLYAQLIVSNNGNVISLSDEIDKINIDDVNFALREHLYNSNKVMGHLKKGISNEE